MSVPVVVVGPKAMSGPGTTDPDLSSIALQCIDDRHALVQDRPRTVEEVWVDVLGAALGGPCDRAVLVCPSWWPDSRIDRVTSAARRWTSEPLVCRRAEVWSPRPAVVELAAELVVVHVGGRKHCVARTGPVGTVLDAVVACLDGLDTVSMDVPAGLSALGAQLIRVLRGAGLAPTVLDDGALVRAALALHVEPETDERPAWWWVPRPRVLALATAGLTIAGLSTAAVLPGVDPVDTDVATWLVEGRIAVEVPATWTVQRVTSGSGSARLQVVSSTDPTEAIHVTQSVLPVEQDVDATAAALRAALAAEPDGVFVDFTAPARRAGRPVVSYREVRADRHIEWTVLADGEVRIAVGCEGRAGRPGPKRQCDQAIRSAHRVLPK